MEQNRIKALVGAQKKIERVLNDSFKNEEAQKELSQLRLEAMKKIFGYLEDTAKSLGDNKVRVEIPEKIYAQYSDTAYIYLNYKCSKSGDIIPFVIAANYPSCADVTKPDAYYYNSPFTAEESLIDNHRNVTKMMIALINHWTEVKNMIEVQIESSLKEKMEKTQEEAARFTEQYELAANFEI